MKGQRVRRQLERLRRPRRPPCRPARPDQQAEDIEAVVLASAARAATASVFPYFNEYGNIVWMSTVEQCWAALKKEFHRRDDFHQAAATLRQAKGHW